MIDRVPPTTPVEGASWRHQDGLMTRRPREPVVVVDHHRSGVCGTVEWMKYALRRLCPGPDFSRGY